MRGFILDSENVRVVYSQAVNRRRALLEAGLDGVARGDGLGVDADVLPYGRVSGDWRAADGRDELFGEHHAVRCGLTVRLPDYTDPSAWLVIPASCLSHELSVVRRWMSVLSVVKLLQGPGEARTKASVCQKAGTWTSADSWQRESFPARVRRHKT